MNYVRSELKELLQNFGYQDIFDSKIQNGQYEPNCQFIKDFNARSLVLSDYNFYQAETVVSILVNMPQLLIRKKSTVWPNGRTSYRFKTHLRGMCTIT